MAYKKYKSTPGVSIMKTFDSFKRTFRKTYYLPRSNSNPAYLSINKIQSLTKSKLEQQKSLLESRIIELEKKSFDEYDFDQYLKELYGLHEKKNQMLSQIKMLQENNANYQQKSGILNALLKSKELRPEIQDEIYRLRKDIQLSVAKLNSPEIGHHKIVQGEILFAKKLLAEVKSAIFRKESDERRVEREKLDVLKAAKKKEELNTLKERAKRTEKERRTIANSVKKKITNSNCPYCGGRLAENAHADHIYPVSKGGNSSLKNMVYVCQKCNLKKKDLTLAQFIKKYDLDRNLIEKRLDKLSKEY